MVARHCGFCRPSPRIALLLAVVLCPALFTIQLTHAQQCPYESAIDIDANDPFTQFLDACMNGPLAAVKRHLHEHPSWINRRSDQNGEVCLHVAALRAQTEITQYLIEQGADVNLGNNHTMGGGSRMNALSINVFAGNTHIVDLLLKNGADVNQDFDSLFKPGKKATCLDLINGILKSGPKVQNPPDPGRQHYYDTRALLLTYGAKRYVDVRRSHDEL